MSKAKGGRTLSLTVYRGTDLLFKWILNIRKEKKNPTPNICVVLSNKTASLLRRLNKIVILAMFKLFLVLPVDGLAIGYWIPDTFLFPINQISPLRCLFQCFERGGGKGIKKPIKA